MAKVPRHSTGDASRPAALLVGQIFPIFSLLAPCRAGASPVSVLAGLLPRAARVQHSRSRPAASARRSPPGPRHRSEYQGETHQGASQGPRAIVSKLHRGSRARTQVESYWNTAMHSGNLRGGVQRRNNMHWIVFDRNQQGSRRSVRSTPSLLPVSKRAHRNMKETRKLFLGQPRGLPDLPNNIRRYLKGPRWFAFPAHNLGCLRGAFNQLFKQFFVHSFNLYFNCLTISASRRF